MVTVGCETIHDPLITDFHHCRGPSTGSRDPVIGPLVVNPPSGNPLDVGSSLRHPNPRTYQNTTYTTDVVLRRDQLLGTTPVIQVVYSLPSTIRRSCRCPFRPRVVTECLPLPKLPPPHPVQGGLLPAETVLVTEDTRIETDLSN